VDPQLHVCVFLTTVLVVSVSDLRVGISVADVVEAVRAVAITTLPGAPGVVEGLIDFRGTIAPVFDLRLRLLNSHVDIVPSDHLLMARAGDRLVAVHVDSVIGLIELDGDSVKPTASPSAASPHLAGVVTLPDGLLFIHDLSTFLSAAERDTLDGAIDTLAAAR
jgi:purine-binding chemotaxis protein CheW